MRKRIKNQQPFEETVKHYVNELGLTPDEALKRVQKSYSDFKNRNERLLERQNNQSNTVQITLSTQSLLLATAVLTFSGAFVASVYQDDRFSAFHSGIFVLIAVFELTSLTLGVWDYIKTIDFHTKWTIAYHEIDKEVDTGISTEDIQSTEDLRSIEAKYIDKQPSATSTLIPKLMAFLAVLGAWTFLFLILSYFYELNFISNINP